MDIFHLNEHGCQAWKSNGSPQDGMVWIDLPYQHSIEEINPVWRVEAERLLHIQIEDLHLQDARNPQHPSYFDSTHAYQMLIFRGVQQRTPHRDEQLSQKTIRLRTRPTVFFISARGLVSLRPADSRSFAAVRARIQDASIRCPNSPQDLALRLMNSMVDRYLELRQPLTDQLEQWQRELLDPRQKFTNWFSLLESRMEIRKLENLCEEQYEAIQEWRDEHLEVTDEHGSVHRLPSDHLLVRVNDLMEHIQRVLNHARRLEASVESAVQLHFSATAYRTNEIMRTLTVITAIFMPLTLITGIFGMNFDVIPGLHTAWGFWLTIGGMALIAVVMLFVFRMKRFFDDRPER
ncbi:magnesium transporter CorA family protein [Parvibium lacunae]|uniref:Magnesium transporter n=1 Tax=Parvibium lacunae TaxID=1888893 RepID=A0A368KZQ3_9BURK|nr:magnesium transporter CorA family protein [Parvibium lacunae]RCS56604.1 magnesium transporter [Parvibium lacunae]